MAPPAEAVAAPRGAAPGTVARLLAHVRTPLYRDGYALVANSAFTAASGLLYWIVAANAYTPHALGVSAALISSMMFLAGISSLNLTNVLVRFLPEAGPNTVRALAWSYGVTSLVAAGAAIVFLAGVGTWSPRLAFLASDGGMQAWFVLSAVGWCLFAIQDGVLTALGRAVWVPVENGVFSLLKLGLLPVFAAVLPEYGIFLSWTLAMLLSVAAVNMLVFLRLARRAHRVAGSARFQLRSPEFRHYFAADYAGSVAWLASINILPLIVTGVAGATTNAYFALAWALAFPLYAVPASVGTSLVLHGAAADRAALVPLFRKAALQCVLVLVPVAVALIALAPLALRLFGHGYSHESATLLRLLAVSGVVNILLGLSVSVARVRRQLRPAVLALWGQALVSLVLAVPFLHMMGVTGAGAAWLVSQCVVAVALVVATRAGAFGDEMSQAFRLRPHLAAARGWAGEIASGAARRRRQSVRMAARVLDDEGISSPAPRPVRTDSDVVVLFAGKHVVKIAWSKSGQRSLAAHAAALTALRGTRGLGATADLLPPVLARGVVDGHRYLVETRLPGVDGRRAAAAGAGRMRTIAAIARGMEPVYAATCREDTAAALALLHERIRAIAQVAGLRHRKALERVRHELANAIEWGRPQVARGHGDLWLGNALLAPGGLHLTGLLDWEASVPGELPATDLAHLVLSSRALGSGRELGRVAQRLISGREHLEVDELALLARHACETLDSRTLVLLAWVQHCAQRLGQGTLHSRRRWVRRNVHPVLAAVRP